MTIEELTRCPSCGLSYVNHPVLISTCRELQEARAEVKRLREQDAALRMIADAAVTEMDGWQERAEAAEAERDLQIKRRVAAEEAYKQYRNDFDEAISSVEAERDRYRDNVKEIAVNFFYHWHNSPGTNTSDGFDEWLAREALEKP